MKCVGCGETIDRYEPHISFAVNKKWHQGCWDHKPTQVKNIRRHTGVAGQFSYTASVTYPGEDTNQMAFVGDAYGDHVIMVSPSGAQTTVVDPCRFGDELNPGWVRRFFRS